MTYDKKVAEAVALASNGNQDAWNYLFIIAKALRIIDDLVDEPEKVTVEDKYKLADLLLVALPSNSFFVAHRL